MQIGLGLGHIVLDGNPATPPQKGGTAWRKANDRALWRRIIDTATLHSGHTTEEEDLIQKGSMADGVKC